MNQDLKDKIQKNRIGWWAIRHKDWWWVGDDVGVTCYETKELARVALTIVWQRDGGCRLNFRIAEFTGADVDAGEYTPKFGAVEALQRYEESSKYDK